MKILLGHNFYQQYGGEDQIFTTEAALLKAHNHQVLTYTLHNDQIAEMNPFTLTQATIWHGKVYRELRALLRHEKPQVAHFHNIFPLISPAAYYAANAEGVPVVQNVQNYRLLCPNALFLRNEGACEDCLGKRVAWPGIVHACYRQNRAATAVVAAMLAIHRVLGSWSEMVDMYIATTEFARTKLIEGAVPAEKIVVKPNLIHPDPGFSPEKGRFALFVGRLSPEKGINTLLTAWQHLGAKLPLKIVGDGPLGIQVAKAAKGLPKVEWLGKLPNDEVLTLMKRAYVLIFTSVCYEALPIVIAEAYGTGLPVIGSNLGAMSSIIDHGRTGLHFRPNDPADLAAQVEWAIEHPAELNRMKAEARQEFEAKYSADRNYDLLMKIYEQVIDQKS